VNGEGCGALSASEQGWHPAGRLVTGRIRVFPANYFDGATRKSGGIEVEQPLQWS
jgi:hypothetical protein